MNWSYIVRSLSTVLVAGVVAGALAGPAEARTRTFKDKRGDVAHAADIQRVKVSYDKRGVVVRIKVRNARAADRQSAGVRVYLDVRRKRRGPEMYLNGPIATDGYDWMTAETRKGWGWTYLAPKCRTRISTNIRRDIVRVQFRKRCLRNPDAVNIRTGKTVHRKSRRAPKKVRVAVAARRLRGAADWAPRHKTFYRAVRRG